MISNSSGLFTSEPKASSQWQNKSLENGFQYLVRSRERSKAEKAVFRLKVDVDAGRDEIGRHGWHPDAQVDAHAALELQSRPASDLLPDDLG